MFSNQSDNTSILIIQTIILVLQLAMMIVTHKQIIFNK